MAVTTENTIENRNNVKQRNFIIFFYLKWSDNIELDVNNFVIYTISDNLLCKRKQQVMQPKTQLCENIHALSLI